MSWKAELAHPDFVDLTKTLLPPGSLVRRYYTAEDIAAARREGFRATSVLRVEIQCREADVTPTPDAHDEWRTLNE